MKDQDIRRALMRGLRTRYQGDPQTLVLEELGLRHGSSRIDVAVVNGSLHGYELKSDRDTLDRLPRQCTTYSAIFDHVTLVTGPRLAKPALEMVPEWWGIELAEPCASGEVGFSAIRNPGDNPAPDSLAIAKLLWRQEALALLVELGQARGFLSKPRSHIYSKLAEVAEIGFLRYRVRDRLRNRADWRSGA